MKKTLMTLAAAAVFAAVASTPSAYDRTLDAARAFAAAESFPTNRLGVPICGVWSSAMTTNVALAAAVDDILAAGRITPVNICVEYAATLPKTWARIKRERADMFPILIAKYDGNSPVWSLEWATRRAFECLHRGNGYMGVDRIEEARKLTLKLVGPYIRRYLRRQGKSIVTVDGVNPQQVLMDEISACLNAPKFTGLEAKLAKIGLNIPIGSYDDVLPSTADLTTLQDKIYYGDVPLDTHLKGVLLMCLGTNGYNAFVKRYNAE